MHNLLKNELQRMFARKKLYVFLILLLCLCLVMGVAIYLIQKHTNLPENQTMQIHGQDFPLTMLSIVGDIIAIFIAILIADLITDEYVNGTLKLPLLTPISRTRFWLAKALSILLSILIFLGFTLICSYIVGTIVGGWGESLQIAGQNLSSARGILATIVAFLTTAIPLWSYALVLMFFALHMTSVGSVIGLGFGFYFLQGILGQLWPASHPYLITSYIEIYQYIFNVQWKPLITGIAVILLYAGLGYFFGLYTFKRKDLLY